MKKGLVLDKVVLLGRTFEEYGRYFGFEAEQLRGKRILDVASGVSSFCAEAGEMGLEVTALDLIYGWPVELIQKRCELDLGAIVAAIRDLEVYRWDFYKSPEGMRRFREKAYRKFLDDYRAAPEGRYRFGKLPELPFADGSFEMTFASYLMFLYEDQFSYEFHRESLREIMRITSGELRVYPLVSFEGKRSVYLDRLREDAGLGHLVFEEVPVDFEFLTNSGSYLKVGHRG